jgi:hypothetical protein
MNDTVRLRVLITVKTYPTLSITYDELVCTASIKEDGSWVRIYPVPFRKLDEQERYAKYQWVEFEAVKNRSDARPETYRPVRYDGLSPQEFIKADGDTWERRRELVLKKVYTNISMLIAEAKDSSICTSLAVFKPSKILDFICKPEVNKVWDADKVAKILAKRSQNNLFADSDDVFDFVPKLPYKFSYRFEDEAGTVSTLMIEDWEIGMLYWHSLTRHNGDETRACLDVRKKYWDNFALTKDLYLFLGTTKEYHFVAPNPFIIIGTFHPKPIVQGSLF